MPSSGTVLARFALKVAIVALAVLAGMLVLATVALALPAEGLREFQLELGMALQGSLPTPVRGLLVLGLPDGGTLRGDFLLCALALVLLDWGLSEVSERIR